MSVKDIATLAADQQFLHSITQSDYHIPDEIDCFAFAKVLLNNFHSTDAHLRDELTYAVLCQIIILQSKLTTPQLEELLMLCIDDEHLFYRIGEVNRDSVFMRSFSVLMPAAILYVPHISEAVIQRTKAALLRYAKEEKDWRGYVEGKGWAHSVAHLADALDECSQTHWMTVEDREEVMMTTSELAKLPEPLRYEEDERLATIAYNIIAKKQVAQPFLERWIESLFVTREEDVLFVPGVTSWVRAANAKNFLRSLYFRLLWTSKGEDVLEPILQVLRRLDVWMDSASPS